MTKKTQGDAKGKILEYLAARDHSEKELRDKLKRRFTNEEIERALDHAKAAGLLRNPEELSQIVANSLLRKKKSIRFIQNFLKKKGLPSAPLNGEHDLAAARELMIQKFRKEPPYNYEEKPKIIRFLSYRGFDHDTIRRVIHERE